MNKEYQVIIHDFDNLECQIVKSFSNKNDAEELEDRLTRILFNKGFEIEIIENKYEEII